LLLLLAVILPACRAPAAGDTAYRLSDSGTGAFEVAMTRFGDGAAVAWYDTRDGNAEIYLRLIDSDGRPVGKEHRLTADAEESYEVSLAPLGDSIAVAWYGRRSGGELKAHIGVWEPAGQWLWQDSVGGDGSSRNPVVRARGQTLFSAWIEQGARADDGEFIRYAFRTAAGEAVGQPQTVGPAGAETWNLNAALAATGDEAYVVYDAPDESGTYELFLATIHGADAELTQLSASDGFASKYPDIALAHDGEPQAALAWTDEKHGNRESYLAIVPLAQLRPRTVDTAPRRLSHSDGASIGSYVAWSSAGIGVAWSDQLSQSYDVLFQPFDRNGRARAPVRAVTATETDSYVPAIVSWNDEFAIAWNEVVTGGGGLHDTAGSEVYFRRESVSSRR
jgi:hypothetical protein